jgi:hypothetical protein
MIKKIIIRQPAGIGDIFFTQKIAYALYETYNVEIIWPVISEFLWIKDYIKVPFIKFVNWDDDFEGKNLLFNNDVSYIFELPDYLIIPLQRADWNYPGISVMDAKYKLVNLNFEDWSHYFNFERNIKKENQLYYDVLGLTDESEYCFINRQFGSPPDTKICKYIDLNNFSYYIEMKYINGFNIFDWCKVIENAKEIHTVETSLNYIIDKINPKGKLEMYSKHTPPSYNQVQHLFKSNWNYNE